MAGDFPLSVRRDNRIVDVRNNGKKGPMMFLSIFSDELGLDVAESLPIIRSWGVDHVDFRAKIFGKSIEMLDDDELRRLRKLLDDHDMTVGCLQSSLCKDHLPDAAHRKQDITRLDGIIRAADALDCRLVRSFHYWQNFKDPNCKDGDLAKRGPAFHRVMEMLNPITDRAQAEGLVLAFENCDVHPDDVFAILDALAVPDWGLAWDVNNSWYCDERRSDENAFVDRMLKRSVAVHVKAGGALNWLKRELIPYKNVLQACHDHGITGPVSIETHNPKNNAFAEKDVSRQVLEVVRLAWPRDVSQSLHSKASIG